MNNLIKAAVVALGMAGGAGLATAQAAPVGFDAGLSSPSTNVDQVQYYARPYGYGRRIAPRGYGYGRNFGYGPRFGYRRHYGPRHGFYGGRGRYGY